MILLILSPVIYIFFGAIVLALIDDKKKTIENWANTEGKQLFCILIWPAVLFVWIKWRLER